MKTAARTFSSITIVLVAINPLFSWAEATYDPQKAAPGGGGWGSDNCAPARELKAAQLFGRWQASFAQAPTGLPATAIVVLQRHAEFSDSLAGTVTRELPVAGGAPTAQAAPAIALLAGDLEEGQLLLDESSDKVSLTGTWNGEMVAGSCGKLFKGVWKDTSATAPDDAPDIAFTLRRLP